MQSFVEVFANSSRLTELNKQCTFAISTNQLEIRKLSSNLVKRFAQFESLNRKNSWLLGRAALFNLAEKLAKEPSELMELNFPQKNYSLTHSQSVAIAAHSNDDNSLGFGIDYEFDRKINPAGYSHFMTDSEIAQCSQLSEHEALRVALKLWCIKEAVFKSTPNNKDLVLLNFELDDVLLDSPKVVYQHTDYKFSINSWRCFGGYFAISQCLSS